MSARFRLTVVVLALLTGGLGIPVPQAQAQQGPLDAQIKDKIKTLAVADGVEGEGVTGLAAGESSVAQVLPSSSGGNVQVSRNQDPASGLRSGASEVAMATSLNGLRTVVGWNDAEGFAFAPFVPGQPPLGLSGYGFTSDGGRTWTDGGAPPIGTTVAFGPGTQGRSATGRYVTRGDPWLDVESPFGGTFYYANLGVWEDDAATPPAGVSLHRGSFKGRSFSWDDSVLIQSPNYPNDFLDKEALAVDGRGRDKVYVSVTNFEEVCNQPFFGFGTIEMYRSLDEGASWSRTVIQPDETIVTDPNDPACGADGVTNQGSMPAVGPNGEVYVAWERGWFAPDSGGSVLPRATIAFARSDNQGTSFTAPAQVTSICSMANDPPAAYNRLTSNDFPRIAVAQHGRHRGRIFITYQDCSAAEGSSAPFGSDTDVYVTFSDDKGATWSTPTPVHGVADGRQQFWPVVSVGTFGQVDVTYYDMRDVNVTPDPDDIECSVRTSGPLDNPVLRQSTVTTFSDAFTARSLDGGRTWGRPRRVTDTSTNWCAATPINSIIPNFGDYNTSLSQLNLFAAWADGRNEGMVDRVPTTWFGRRF